MNAEKPHSTVHDVLATYGPLIKHAAITLNSDLTPTEGESLVAAKKITAGVFRWFWISNTDLVLRLREGKELNTNVNIQGLYGGGLPRDEESQAKGYRDHPFVS